MITIGCCAFAFKGWPLDKALAFAADAGFTHVSVGANHAAAQVNPLEAAARPEPVGLRVRELAARHGLTLVELFICPVTVEPGRAVEPNDPDPAARAAMLDVFEGLCRFAAEAGFANVMGVPGVARQGRSEADDFALAAETLGRMVGLAERAGVRFTVEAHSGSIVNEPARALRLLEAVPGLMLTLDYAHFIGAGIDAQAVRPLHPHAFHVHAKPSRPGKPVCPLAENATDFRAILTDLHAGGYAGVISTECFGDTATSDFLAHPATKAITLAAELHRVVDDLP